jgi:hypothetical protein
MSSLWKLEGIRASSTFKATIPQKKLSRYNCITLSPSVNEQEHMQDGDENDVDPKSKSRFD